jgi:CBS domain-containing protein
MANKNPDPTLRRENGTPGGGNGHGHGHGHGHGEPERDPALPRSTAGTSRDPGRPGEPDTGGRHYARAMGRPRQDRSDDRLLGMGYAAPGRGSPRGERREETDRPAYRAGYRGDYGRPERGYEGWTGGFAADEAGGRTFRPPEEEWERTHHYRVRSDTERGARWEREPCIAEDIMTRNPKSVRPEASLREVAEIMRDENCGIVPVIAHDRRLVGLITDRDMVMRTLDAHRPWIELTAGEVMSDELEAVTPDEPVREIIHLMGSKQVRRVPVVDRQDRLLGMIAMADVANRADMDDELQDALDAVSRRRSFWRRLWT